MKRVVYLLIVVAAAAAFYVLVYARLTGTPTDAAAPSTAQSSVPAPAGASGQARRGGGGTVAVVTAVAARQNVPIVKYAVGFIEATDVAVVRPRTDGLIIETDVVPGQDVKQGDVLFKLDPGPTNAIIARDNAQLAKDQATADLDTAELTRAQSLFSKGDDNQDQLDTAAAAAKVATGVIGVDQAQLSSDQLTLSYLTITAPIDGRVGVVNTSNGNVVHAADTSAGGLLTITRLSTLRASFSVPEGDLDTYKAALASKTATPVKISVPGENTPRATGKLSFLDTSVDTGSGTIIAKADVDNSAGQLWPGQYVSVSVEAGAYSNATTVPVVAVQQSSNGPFVFQVGSDGKIKKLPVTVVATVGDTAIIGPELSVGAHVVVEGQLGLSDGEMAHETVQAQPAAAPTTPGTNAAGRSPPPQKSTDAGASSAPASSSSAS